MLRSEMRRYGNGLEDVAETNKREDLDFEIA